jgi:hypothetical protein
VGGMGNAKRYDEGQVVKRAHILQYEVPTIAIIKRVRITTSQNLKIEDTIELHF